MASKYSVGDVVIITKRLSLTGVWEDVKPCPAKVLEVRDTVSLGPAHVLEVDGKRLGVCYWESDIESKVTERLYNDPDFQWKVWGDQ